MSYPFCMNTSDPRCSAELFERKYLDHALCPEVDRTLKELKLATRRLQAALSVFSDETRILERLYYKSKNQHRGALFWRRVVEIRRFCGRVQGANLLGTMNRLRFSFFGPDSQQTQSVSKGSWTHYPNAALMESMSATLAREMLLLDKMQQQMLGAYHSFMLSLQSGAFLQMLLAMAAIASRLRALSLEMRDIIRSTHATSHRLASVIAASTKKILNDIDPDHIRDVLDKSEGKYASLPVLLTNEKDYRATARPSEPGLTHVEQLASTRASSALLSIVKLPRVTVRQKAIATDNTKKGVVKGKKPKPDEIDAIFGD